MSKQVSIAAAAAVKEANAPQVINSTIMGARRCDATKNNGDILEGVIILFKEPFPIVIDGEMRTANKKWFTISNVIDSLIMSEDDNVAARVDSILSGNYMSLRGISAHLTIYNGEDDDELHYKLEF